LNDWLYISKNWYDFVKNDENIWFQIVICCYFEIEVLRNDFLQCKIFFCETADLVNQIILETHKFKFVVGKNKNKYKQKPTYYDIDPNSILLELINKNWDRIESDKRKLTTNMFYYKTKKLLSSIRSDTNQGFINYLRISKAKYIESLNISIHEKQKLHERMNHNYITTINNYL